MKALDEKILKHFPDESVLKEKQNYSSFAGRNLPSFIKDWLVKRFTSSDGSLDETGLKNFMDTHIPSKDESILVKLKSQSEPVKILSRFNVQVDLKNDKFKFEIPDHGITLGIGVIPDYVFRKHKDYLSEGEHWGVITLVYVPPSGKDKGNVQLIDFKAFQPYRVDLSYFQDARKHFSLHEWIDLIIRSMEYNPDFKDPVSGFNTIEQKLLFISRLLIFVEPNLNLIELAPKGTGKSYVFGNLSKYTWMFSGGVVSRAKLLYDIAKSSPGIIENYDFVTFDEIETIKFADEDELLGALKNYLESGRFTVANYSGTSEAGLMLLGNIQLINDWTPLSNKYFSALPQFFQSSALMDRIHGFIEGWKLVRLTKGLIINGLTLNVEYFSEILHKLRECSEYSKVVEDLVYTPQNADTRDEKAVKKLATAYLKLLFPHVRSAADIDKDEFNTYCLIPAMNKRRIIREQRSYVDTEVTQEMPKITIKK
ncbi:MAG: BREX system Lon protease-like protein BrxL [Bacilli bacterium]|nr:BREX system Lon protease-like protein BrxL [Bacilli bacterium]